MHLRKILNNNSLSWIRFLKGLSLAESEETSNRENVTNSRMSKDNNWRDHPLRIYLPDISARVSSYLIPLIQLNTLCTEYSIAIHKQIINECLFFPDYYIYTLLLNATMHNLRANCLIWHKILYWEPSKVVTDKSGDISIYRCLDAPYYAFHIVSYDVFMHIKLLQ